MRNSRPNFALVRPETDSHQRLVLAKVVCKVFLNLAQYISHDNSFTKVMRLLILF